MKIAISGKGGVGKTLLASHLCRIFADSGYSVLAIDADPNSTLAATLGFPHPEDIIPISEMKDVIAERTGSVPGKKEVFFKLNPRVEDLPEKYWQKHAGIKLMVMGRVKKGGAGCYCSDNVLLRALTSHILLERNEVIIMDMEAGIEHLSRATASAVNKLIIVVEPARRSLETAATVKRLANDIGLESIGIVGNKIHSSEEKKFIVSSMPGFDFLGFIPYDQAIIDADLAGRPLIGSSDRIMTEVKNIFNKLVAPLEAGKTALTQT